MRSGFTYTGLFETKEDGTTIYYYGRRDGHALGYHVDEAAMRSIRRLYAELFAASVFGISCVHRGYRWTALLLAAVAAAFFIFGTTGSSRHCRFRSIHGPVQETGDVDRQKHVLCPDRA